MPIINVEDVRIKEFGTVVESEATHCCRSRKRQITDLFVARWGRWNVVPIVDAEPTAHKFSTIDHIPKVMRRQETWALEYRRNPYMHKFTNEQVRERFDKAI